MPFVNKTCRIFVSSTFRDMMEEREALMTHAWPELRLFCRERQVELVEVDLRWGIAEEQSTRKETLKLCLDEIRACRPYFVGVLGERYGWVPGDDAFTADLKEEQPWLKDLQGKSVTELEILHGVLNNPEMAGRAFFYFRDPDYVKTVPDERRSDFLPEDPASAEKQAALKSVIRTTCSTKNIPLYENYPDPQSLAQKVLEQLKDVVDRQFPKENIYDALTREARDHEAFAEIRRRTYIGRPGYFDALDSHCRGSGGPLLLLADSGGGKSALIANWIERWRKAHPGDYIFQHYIGGTRDSAIHWKLMKRLMGEIKRWTGDNEELPGKNDDILRGFPVWLDKARAKAEREGIKFVVILDALNQLEDKDHARVLGWLPMESFRDHLRLIVSTLPGSALEVLEKRPLERLRIEPLTPAERGRMIEDYLRRFGKSLDKPRIERLSNAGAAANPLYLKILLDELRVTGTHETLDERLDDYLKAEDIPALFGAVLARYRRDYEHDRKGLVSETLGLIWSARRGLSETEVLELLHPEHLPRLPLATWSPLRAALEESLVDRGGILNFANDFMRTAVETAFLPGLDRQDDFRTTLAGYFEAQPPTARNCDELPWLLARAKLFQRLRSCLLNMDRFLEIYERDDDELRGYWILLGEEKAMGRPYLDSFNAWKEANSDRLISRAKALGLPSMASALRTEARARISYGANTLGAFLKNAALYTEAEPLYRLGLKIVEESLGQNHPHVAHYLRDLGLLLKDTNRLIEAEPILRRALKIDEESSGRDHPDVARDLNHLSALLLATNRLGEVEPLMRRALHINEKTFGPDHPEVAANLNNLAMLLQNTNRLSEAESLMRRALKIKEDRFGKDHPEAGIALHTLADLLQAAHRKNEAEPLMRRVIPIFEKSFGENHPNVASGLGNLALLLMETNRPGEAEPLMRRALKIDEDCFGKDHPKVALRLHNLSWILSDMNRLREAEPVSRRAVEIYVHCSRTTGRPHHQLKPAMSSYAALLETMGWRDEQIIGQLRRLAPGYF